MKWLKLLLFWAMLFLGSQSVFAQNWFPIGATWYYDNSSFSNSYEQIIKLQVAKDTVVLGIDCKLLTQKNYFIDINSHLDSNYKANLFAWERNDSVYFLQNDSFLMIYNFDNSLGDSSNVLDYFPYLGEICDSADSILNYRVDSTGMLTINGQALKYYVTNVKSLNNSLVWPYQLKIMERIGSTEFIYPTYTCGTDVPWPQSLRCYSDSIIGLYQPDANFPCFSFPTAINELSDFRSLRLFPNPTNDYVTLDYGFTDWNKGAVSLEITNELGQVVYTQPLPMYSGFQQLDVARFAAGMYNVAVKRGGAVVAVAKLVKE
jgi:hypothetical protein